MSKSNQGADQLSLSTITKKSAEAESEKKKNENSLQRVALTIDRSVTLKRSVMNKSNDAPYDSSALRKEYLLDLTNAITLKLVKKSKKLGTNKVRDIVLDQNDVLNFKQKKNKGKKSYEAPNEFIPQTRGEFLELAQKSQSQKDPDRMINWSAKEVQEMDYRLIFKRRDNAKSSDSAFYFTDKEQFIKITNYFKCVQMLEKTEDERPSVGQLALQAILKGFRGQLVKRVRNIIGKEAQRIKGSRNTTRDLAIKNATNLIRFNSVVVQSVLGKWKENSQLANSKKDRKIFTVENSPILNHLNAFLVQSLTYAWKQAAEAKIEPNKENISVEFSTIEISTEIPQPKIEVIVNTGKNYPDSLCINNKPYPDRTCTLYGGCRIQEQINSNLNVWSIYPKAETTDSLNDFVLSIGLEQKFIMDFNSYQRSYLDQTEVTINLFNDEDNKICYTTVSLKYLYEVSKRGQDIWLWLRPKAGEIYPKQAFVHLNVKSISAEKISRQVSVQRPLIQNIYDRDFIEDSFYKYSFKMPAITPKHTKFLEKMDPSWGLLDETTRGLYSSHEYGKYIQRIKYNLFRHYQSRTSRKLAHLRKGEDVWAIFQSDLASYAAKHEGNELGKIWLKLDELDKQVKPKTDLLNHDDNILSQQDGESIIVSYLHKRAKWENKEEWKPFFQRLANMACKGFPQQSRIDIWSQLGQVAYYMLVTEEIYTKHVGLQSYKEGNFPPPGHDEDQLKEQNINLRGQRIYNKLKADSLKENVYLYQELEDDIKELRETFDKPKLPYENNIRNVLKAFIFWLKIVTEASEEERYYVNYSRSLLNICMGITVCQNCSYLSNPVVDEYQIFWLLVSLSTYILPSYYEASHDKISSNKTDDRRRNNIVNSAMRCSQMKGVKSDLLLLKFLLQENAPNLYKKFEEFGVPLDYYFADHMTSLFFNLFNPGLTFRLWDIFFFEGSNENPVRCNSMIVCVIFKLLLDCEQLLLKAKKASDISFFIELYAKFQTKYSSFIKGVYKIANKYLIQKIPNTDTFKGRLELITYALFSNEYNRLDKKIKMIESKIEGHYKDVHQQNNLIYELVTNTECHISDSEKVQFNYNLLSRMVRDFRYQFGILNHKMEFKRKVEEDKVKDEFENVNARKKKVITEVKFEATKFQCQKVASIHFKIHKLTLYWPEIDHLSVEVTYEKETLTKKNFSSLNLNFEGEFITRKKEIDRYMTINIYDQKDPNNRLLIKNVVIDLKGLPINSITKQIFKINESDDTIPNNNNVASEAEISILLIGVDKIGQDDSKAKFAPTSFIEDLEHPEYKEFRQLQLDKIFKPVQTQATINPQAQGQVQPQEVLRTVEEDPLNVDSYKYTLMSKTRHAWKNNFAIEYDDFEDLMKKIAPFWQNVRYKPIFEAMKKVNQNNTFYVNDFLTLLILFGKFTLSQKLSLMFEVLANFDDRFKDKSSEVPYFCFKGLADYLYDIFMIYIPYNEIENLVDMTVFGYTSSIKKVVINAMLGEKIELPKASLNRLTNYIHLNFHMKEIHLYHQDILSYIRKIYDNELRGDLPPRQVNSIEITYFANNTSHKIKLEVDANWRILLDQNDPYDEKSNMSILLHKFRYIISLSHAPHILDKERFIKSFQKLPLFNYMVSFENRDVKNTLTGLKEFKFIVQMHGENLFIASPDDNITRATNKFLNLLGNNEEKEERKKFYLLLREWDDMILKAGIKPQVGGKVVGQNQKRTKAINAHHIKVPSYKTDLNLTYDKILQNIKRVIMRDIFSTGNRNISSLNEYSPYLLNENLYNFRGDVTLRINDSKAIEVANTKQISPFRTLMELIEDYGNNEKLIQSVEFIYSLSDEKMPEPEFKHPSQLARYRFADGSTDWWPCQLKLRYQYKDYDNKQKNAEATGYGVTFDQYPTETVLKKNIDVAIINAVDLDELQFKNLERVSYRPLVYSPEKKRGSIAFDDDIPSSIRKNLNPQKYDPKLSVTDEIDEHEFGGKLKIKHDY